MFTPGRSRRWMVAWAASLTAMSMMQAALAGRSVQVDRVSRGTATFSTSGSLTTITASNRAVINYTQFDIANGQTVKFVQPTVRSRVLNRIISNAPSMLDGTLLANGIVYFVNPAGVMFGAHSIVSVSGIIAAAGNITDNNFAAGVDHFSGSAAVVNNGTVSGNSVQLVGQSVANHGTINAQGGLIAMVAGQDVLLEPNGSNILVKIAATNSTGGVSNDGTINAAGGTASLVSGDLYSMALGTPGVIKANQVTVQGGNVAISGTIDASNANGVGGTVTVTGQNVNVAAATIDASGQTGGGTVLLGGNFHGAGPLENAQTTSISADSVIRADSTGSGNGGQVAVWSDVTTSFAGTILATGGTGGYAEVSSHQTLNFNPTKIDLGGGKLLLDPASITIIDNPSNADINGDGTTGDDITGANELSDASADYPGAASVISSGALNTVLSGSSVTLAATDFITDSATATPVHVLSGMTLTLDAPTINLSGPINVDSGGTLAGGATVVTANVHNGGLIQNGIDVLSASTAAYPVVNVDPGTYAEDVNIRQGSVLVPITVMATGPGTITVNSLTVGLSHPVYLDGSYIATDGFTINDEVHAGLPAPVVGAAQDLTFTGPMVINNDGGGASLGSIDSNNQNVTIITDSLAMATLAQIDNFSGSSGQGMLTIEPITASTAIGIGDSTPPTAPIEIDPIDNIGGDLRQVVIGSTSGSGAITIGASTFASPVTIQSPAAGGTITINGAVHAYFGTVGNLVLKAPSTASAITITAPIDTDSPMIAVEIDGGTSLSSSITTQISPITINGDVTLAGTASLDTTYGEGSGLTAGANIYVASLSDGGGHGLTLNSGTAGTITFAGNVDNVSDLTVTQSDGVTFEGTVGAGTAGNVTINGTQPAATILFDGAANILTLTAGAGNFAIDFNSASSGQSSIIQTAFLSNTGGLSLGNAPGDSIVFTNGLNYQAGSTAAIGTISTSPTGNIVLAATILTGDTTITAGSVDFAGTLDSDSNATPRNLTITAAAGMLVFDGPFTAESLTAAAAAVTFHATGQIHPLGNVVINAVSPSPAYSIDLNGGTYNDTSFTFTAPVILTADTAITASGDVDFQSTIDSDSSSTERSLTINTPGTTTFGGGIGDTHPLSSLTSSASGMTVINGSAITTAETQTFNNPVSLGAFVTLKGTTISFNNTLAGNSHDLTVNSANTVFGQTVTGIGTLVVVNAANINADITSSGSQSYGAATLGADVTLSGAALAFGSITGGSHNLTLNPGSVGTINVSGNVAGIGALTIVNGTGATFAGTFAANSVTIDDTYNNQNITFDGAATIGTFTADGTANAYNISFNAAADGQPSTITNATFDNTGNLILGNDPTDAITFTNGLTHTAGPTSLSGTLTATDAPITLGALAVQTTSTIDAGLGAINLGQTTITGSSGTPIIMPGTPSLPTIGTLILGAANSGPITVAGVAGTMGDNAADVIFNTTGAITVSGAIGTNIGIVTITQAGGAMFDGAVAADTVILENSTGAIMFNEPLTLSTLMDAVGNFDLQFLSSVAITSDIATNTTTLGTTTLGTSGTVTFGNGDVLTFAGGVTHTAGPNIINGILESTDSPINLNSATNVTGDSTITAGSGAITLGGVTLVDGVSLQLGTQESIAVPLSSVNTSASDIVTDSEAQSGDITVASFSGGTTSSITFSTSGNVTVSGAVGSIMAPFGNLYVESSRTAVFGGDIYTSGDIGVYATNFASDPGSGDLVFHGNLTAGGNITLSPGSALVPIGNIANANATGTITFYGNSITAGGNISLAVPPVFYAGSELVSQPVGLVGVPAVANIIALGSPTTVNGFTGIALNIQAGTLTMGSDANLSSPAGGVAISLGSGTSTIGSITALGSIDISAASGATINVVDRGDWQALNAAGQLIPEHGTVLFAGGQGQPDILSTPDQMQANGYLTKFAVSFATKNAKAGRSHLLKSNQLVSADQLQYTTGGTTYYLMNPLPTSSGQPVAGVIVPPQVNQIYIQENIDFDSAMRKQFWRLGWYGRDITLDTVDGGIIRPPTPSEKDWSNVTLSLATPAANP